MNYSFGDNKRKPGSCSSAVTESKRRHTLAQTWDLPSKQRKAPSESVIPSILARNAGNQSWFNAKNNGSLPFYPCLDALTGLFEPLNITNWSLNGDAVQSANAIELVSGVTNKTGSAFYNTALDPTFPFRINATVSLGPDITNQPADGFTLAFVNNLNYIGGGGGGCGFTPKGVDTDAGFGLRIDTYSPRNAYFLDIDGDIYASGSLTNTASSIVTSGAFVQLDYDGVTLTATITSIIDPTKVDTLTCKVSFRRIFGDVRCYFGVTAATGGSAQLTVLTDLSYTPTINPLCTPLPSQYYLQGWRFAGFDIPAYASPTPLPTYDAISTWGTRNDTELTNLGVLNGSGGTIVPSQTGKNNTGVFFSGLFRAPYSGSYVFKASSDDGIEMYVNGSKIFNSPIELASVRTSSAVVLSAGAYYVVSGLWTNRDGGLQFIFTDILVNGASIWTPTLFQNSIYSPNDGNSVVLPTITSGWQFATYSGNNLPDLFSPSGDWGTRNDALVSSLSISVYSNGVIVPTTGAGNTTLYFSGYFRAPVSGSYVFTVISDDGIQIVLNGSTIMNHTNYISGPVDSTSISLTAGQYYPIRGLWANGGGPGSLQISDIKVGGSSIVATYPLNTLAFK